MFAVTHGAWPRVTPDGIDLDTVEADVMAGRADGAALLEAVQRSVAEIVRVQVEAGLELVTDGQVRSPDLGETTLAGIVDGTHPLVDAWRATAGLTDRPVAQAVPGPYSLARGGAGGGGVAMRTDRTLALADALAADVRALWEAGCPVVMVEEPRAVDVGEDPAERTLFADAQRRLLGLAPELHAMLVVSGGTAHAAGPEAILAGGYRSFLLDLIGGPDNWYLVRATPGDRGIVCGALRVEDPPPADQVPLLIWGARYAASAGGRGLDRVGLANAAPLRRVSPETAGALVRELGRAARLASADPETAIAAGVDPRTFGRPRPVGPSDVRMPGPASSRNRGHPVRRPRGSQGA